MGISSGCLTERRIIGLEHDEEGASRYVTMSESCHTLAMMSLPSLRHFEL